MAETSQTPTWKTGAVLISGAPLIGAVIGVVIRFGANLPIMAVLAIIVALFALLYPVLMNRWRTLDEMARQAHLTAWFWAAPFAGGLACALIFALSVRGIVDAPMFQGACIVLLAQCAASIIVRTVWWARRRARPVG